MRDDLISRQAAIDALSNGALVNYQNAGHNNGLVKAIDVIKGQPAAQQWILCNESLPAVGVNVLVCYKLGQIRYVSIGELLGDGEFHGCDDEYLTKEGRKRKAVAWMPLPEPYKQEENR